MHSHRTPQRSWFRRREARQRGFTLLELMVTLTVAGILLSVGVPSFFQVIRENRAAAGTNEFVTALSIARSEAVRRGGRVAVCRSADGASCGGTWAQGWIVFVDSAGSDTGTPVVANAAALLRAWQAPVGNPAIAGPDWVKFLPRGDARSAAGLPATYTIVVDGCSGNQARDVEINAVGRTTVDRVACP